MNFKRNWTKKINLAIRSKEKGGVNSWISPPDGKKVDKLGVEHYKRKKGGRNHAQKKRREKTRSPRGNGGE